MPQEVAKNPPKRLLFTDRRGVLTKSISDSAAGDDMKEHPFKPMLSKKRRSMFVPSLTSKNRLKPALLDRNQLKRKSIHQNHTVNIGNTANADDVKEEMDKLQDIKNRYEHLLAENELLKNKNNSKPQIAPRPSLSISFSDSVQNEMIKAPVFTPTIVKKQRSKTRVVPRKSLDQCPTKKMLKIEWIPIPNDKIKDTRWKYMEDEVKIPQEFEDLFCILPKPQVEQKTNNTNESELKFQINNANDEMQKVNSISHISLKRAERVKRILNGMNLSSTQIRKALLNVDQQKLTLRTLYNLLEIAPSLNEQKYVQNKMNHLQMNAFSSSTQITEIEEFFYELSDINHLELRIQLILFRTKFQDAIDTQYHDLVTLSEALKSVQRSSAFERILSVILSFGNYMNASSNDKKYGIYGFELKSLQNLKNIQSNVEGVDFLSFVCKFCAKSEKYKNCLDVISDLSLCYEASQIKSDECHQKILLITEELSKFNISLRKLRKAAVPTPTSPDKEIVSNGAYKPIQNDLFETTMRGFARKAQLVCKSLLDLRQDIINIAQILSSQYNFDLNQDKIEDFLKIFADFVSDLKRAKHKYQSRESKLRQKAFSAARKQEISAKLNAFLSKRS